MLFDSFSNQALTLQNRVVMAPMTRCRTDHRQGLANDLMVEYYRQRAAAGLIISEGVVVSDRARGYVNSPGLYSEAHAASWQKVTAAVHAAGGKIFAQLWHCGRVAHSALHADGSPPAGASDLAAKAKTFIAGSDGKPVAARCETPQALSTFAVKSVVREFAEAARLARSAGFDGVEIHGANGYLFDQFRCPFVNRREDEYGGSLENRYRLLLDTVDAVAAVFEPARIAVRQSPYGTINDMQADPEPLVSYPYLARELDRRGVGFLHINVLNSSWDDPVYWIHQVGHPLLAALRLAFRGALVACGGYDLAAAEQSLARGDAQLIAFGRPFISNPDLVQRMRCGAELAPWDLATFYDGGARGYTDYPAMALTASPAADTA